MLTIKNFKAMEPTNNPFDFQYECQVPEVQLQTSLIYANVKSVLGHDNFSLQLSTRRFVGEYINYGIVNDESILLGEVTIQNTESHVLTEESLHYTTYRFHDYAIN